MDTNTTSPDNHSTKHNSKVHPQTDQGPGTRLDPDKDHLRTNPGPDTLLGPDKDHLRIDLGLSTHPGHRDLPGLVDIHRRPPILSGRKVTITQDPALLQDILQVPRITLVGLAQAIQAQVEQGAHQD